MRALVIEDDFLHSTVLGQILRNMNFEVDVAGDQAQAYDYIDRGEYQAIFCDICLPNDTDGFEIMARLRHINPDFDGMIVGMSAYGQDGLEYLCHRMGIDDFLFKPFNEAEIRDILKMDPLPQAVEEHTEEDIDLSCLRRLERLFDDREKLHKLLLLFESDIERLDRELNNLPIHLDCSRVMALTHQLKSNAKLFGAIGLAKLLLLIEDAGTAENIEKLTHLASEIRLSFPVYQESMVSYFSGES